MLEGLRDRWEHMAPRERRLMALLGVTGVITVFAFIGMIIGDGLDSIEGKNQERRDALDALEVHRARAAEPSQAPKIEIHDEALDLPVYLSTIAGELQISIPGYSPQPTVTRGAFDEISTSIDLREVTLDQLSQFLERVETSDRTVVVTALHIERSFRDQDKLRKASMTVTTYVKKPKAGEEKPAEAAAPEAEEGG